MRLITRLLALLALGSYCWGQAPANSIPLCSENCTILSATTPAVYEFGANGRFNTINSVVYPLVVNCSLACPQVGGDPIPNVVKAIYAMEQAVSYQVVWQSSSGVKTTVTVPALPVKYVITCTTQPTTLPSSATIPATCTVVKQ